MHLTATNKPKRQTALWRLFTLILAVVGINGSSAGIASAHTTGAAVSPSGQTTVVGLETRVGVTTTFSGGSSARIPTISPACVGKNHPGYDINALASCVATKTVGAVCSFGGETRVLMADGTTKPISKIVPGDMVFAQDPETGEIGARRVTDAWVHDDDLVRLEIDGDVVRTTEDHPFWNDTDKQWQRADQLDSGDLVLTADGRGVKVGLLVGSAGRGSAYNFTVEGLHTYHVLFGDDAVLVHNACPTGLKNASEGFKSIFDGGSVQGKSIIGIRSNLLDDGFTQVLSNNKQGYLFRNSLGEEVRVMARNGQWEVRVRNQFGNYLDATGAVVPPNAAHGITVVSK